MLYLWMGIGTNILLFPTFLGRISPMIIDYGKFRHFCGDPVCPGPVWKPVKSGSERRGAD